MVLEIGKWQILYEDAGLNFKGLIGLEIHNVLHKAWI